jgi:hypothetical protein
MWFWLMTQMGRKRFLKEVDGDRRVGHLNLQKFFGRARNVQGNLECLLNDSTGIIRRHNNHFLISILSLLLFKRTRYA